MKRTVLISVVVFAACGVPKEEHEKAIGKLQEELAQSRADKEKLEGEVKKYSGELTTASSKADSLAQDVAASKEELTKLRKQREQYQSRMQAFQALAEKLKSMVDAGKLKVQIRKGRMLVQLPDSVLFPAGSATLKKEGQATLGEIGKALAEIKDRDFVVAGHTDNLAIKTQRFPSNWELSSQRAIEVSKFLIAQGVEPAHVSAAGYAEHDPLVANDTPENRQANRRIEIIVMPNIEELPKMDEKT
jgi:chemotaxis protein MotB